MDYEQEKIKILGLFVHNLKYYSPMAKLPDLISSGIVIQKDFDELMTTYEGFSRWSQMYRENGLDSQEGKDLTNDCYATLMRLKFIGVVGELIDESSQISKLGKDIINLKDELTRVINDRDRRKQEGIELADSLNMRLNELASCRKELEDTRKKLADYEGGKPTKPDWRATT